MGEGNFSKDECSIDAAVATLAAAGGEIRIQADGRAGVREGAASIAVGDVASWRVEGQIDVDSASATTFAVGAPVFWDASANLAVPPAVTLDGSADFYLGRAVKAKIATELKVRVDLNAPGGPGASLGVGPILRSFIYEFDCETGIDAAAHTLIPAWANPNGILILGVYGIVSEVFGGGSEDQAVVTVSDSAASPNAIATLTPSNAGADALKDVIAGASQAPLFGAATGVLMVTVAAGLAVTGAVTTPTSGGSAAGKMKVFVLYMPWL